MNVSNAKQKRQWVALVDFWSTGHHPSTFNIICKALLDNGNSVLALCPHATELPGLFSKACSSGDLLCRTINDFAQPYRWRRKIHDFANELRMKACRSVISQAEEEYSINVNVVLFPSMYNAAAISAGRLDRIFPYKWSALLLESWTVRGNIIDRLLRLRCLRPLAGFAAQNCVSIGALDPAVVRNLRSRFPQKPIYWFPEPSTDVVGLPIGLHEAQIRSLAAGRKVIAGFGEFAHRKGATLFLDLVRACKSKPWFFLWVGELALHSFSSNERVQIRELIAAPPQNCLLILEHIAEEEEFGALLRTADVFFLCYRRFAGSSGLLSKAARLHKPSIVHAGFCMAAQVEEFDLGKVVDEDSPIQEYISAVGQLLHAPAEAGRYRRYEEKNSSTVLRESLRSLISQAAESRGL